LTVMKTCISWPIVSQIAVRRPCNDTPATYPYVPGEDKQVLVQHGVEPVVDTVLDQSMSALRVRVTFELDCLQPGGRKRLGNDLRQFNA
jgi:hypothetical protein